MLVLTRRKGEIIHIGQDIIITVLEVGSGKVRIGITAPKDTPIHREEIFRRIQQENKLTEGPPET